MLCMSQLSLSARAYHRTQSVKLARTIADLEGVRKFNGMLPPRFSDTVAYAAEVILEVWVDVI